MWQLTFMACTRRANKPKCFISIFLSFFLSLIIRSKNSSFVEFWVILVIVKYTRECRDGGIERWEVTFGAVGMHSEGKKNNNERVTQEIWGSGHQVSGEVCITLGLRYRCWVGFFLSEIL